MTTTPTEYTTEQLAAQAERHDVADETWTMRGTFCGTCGLSEDEAVHDPAEKTTHLVIGQLVWGTGRSLVEAKAQFRRQGGRLGKYHLIVEFPEGCVLLGVTGMGGWRYRPDVEGMHPIQTEVNDGKF